MPRYKKPPKNNNRNNNNSNHHDDASSNDNNNNSWYRIFRYYVRIPVLLVVCVVMLDVDYQTIKETVSGGGGGVNNGGLVAGDVSYKNKTTTTASSIIMAFVAEKLGVTVIDVGGGGGADENNINRDAEEETTKTSQQEDGLLLQSPPPPPTDDTDTLHYSNTAILELLDWEWESLKGITSRETNWSDIQQQRNHLTVGSCHPPNGISDICCIGSFSQGGGLTAAARWQCREGIQKDLSKLQTAAHEFFQNNPLPTLQVENKARPVVECDVCRIIELAHVLKLNIVLMGDSMHSQIAGGLSCELQRRQYEVTSEIIKHQFKGEGVYNRKHDASILMHIKSPLWKKNSEEEEDDVVTIKFHMIYMVPLCQDCGDLSSLTGEADVLIMGFGLHWWYYEPPGVQPNKGQNGYLSNMKHVISMIRDQGRVQLLVHRETSAQHFANVDGGGYEFWKYKSYKDFECKAFDKENGRSVYWREKTIRKAVEQLGMQFILAGPNMPPPINNNHSTTTTTTTTNATLTELISLPYFHYTAQFPNMHPANHEMVPQDERKERDCTHYCSSPYVYYPLWRSLRLAMDRKFASSEVMPPKQ